MASGGRKVTLKSSDGEVFEVDVAVALEFQAIKDVIEKDVIENRCADSGLPLPNVSSKILAKVIEYCKYHVDALTAERDEKSSEEDEEVKNWDSEFVKVDQATLFHLIMAANYLHIEKLIDLTTQTVADMINGKTVDEMRKILNIKYSGTPEEEEEDRRENQWAFE